MTLIDAGPMIALIDASDPLHATCVQAAVNLKPVRMATTWACFTEAMYLLGTAGGYRFQESLWRIRRDGRLDILELTAAETDRMEILMGQYRTVPMDLADASLVAVAETRNPRHLFTVDSDFYT